MKIKNSRNAMVTFGSIKEGDVFLFSGSYGDVVCMKTETTYGDDNGYYDNAVCLRNGSLLYFEDDKMVIPVQCELVIE